MRITFIGLALCMAIASGCGTNPVSGDTQITLMSQEREIELGAQQYSPSQQSQGGVYLVDKQVNIYINKIGQSLAKHSAQPDLPYEFVVLNNDVPNAWALPGGKIAINRGLLVLLEDESQLAAVLGHEIVHAAARHGAARAAKGIGMQILSAILSTQTTNSLYRNSMDLGGGAVQAHYGRENELESDYYGIDYMVADGYDPQGAVELQQTFLNLSKERGNQKWLGRLFSSHPPSAERVRQNQARAKQLPKGKRNKAAYENAISQILKDKKAYELHNDALTSARNDEWDKALSLTNKAIKKQPSEARFYITKGRILDQKDKTSMALKEFNKAIKLEPNYFSGFYYRGLTHKKMNHISLAQKDFLASNNILETQYANYYLGEIALEKNQRRSAIEYYRLAKKGGGEVAKAATGKLRQLGVR